ncbi:MAG: response regulator [Phreatobacter sp.]
MDADQAVKVPETRSDIGIVMTDIQMGGSMDGLKLTHAIRKRWPSVILIVISARARPSQDELPAGTSFLSKPGSAADIEEALRQSSQQARQGRTMDRRAAPAVQNREGP